MDTITTDEMVKITVDVTRHTADLLSQEARDNKRSRKSQIEVALEKHAERYEKRLNDQ